MTPTQGTSSTSQAVKTEFSIAEARTVVQAARAVVEQSVRGDQINHGLPAESAQAPVYGGFLTLKRGQILRACRGRWASAENGAGATPLGQLLATVARETALYDSRFPTICPQELPFLALDVSVMFGTHTLTERGGDRLDGIEVGKHGLCINHPQGRGLLLPQVATENQWDAETFLQQLCRKAGLSEQMWQDDKASITTFQATVLDNDPSLQELDVCSLNAGHIQTLLTAINMMLRDEPFRGRSDQTLTQRREQELGIQLETASGLTATAMGHAHGLIDLAQMAVRSLKRLCARKQKSLEPVTAISLLWQPIRLQSNDYPNRHRTLAAGVVLAENGQGGWSLALPNQGGQDPVAKALQGIGVKTNDWTERTARLTAFRLHRFVARRGPVGQSVRAASQGGRFYPADPRDMRQAIEGHLAADPHCTKPEKEAYRAVMLPHAGWRFCGDTIGKTIRRVRVPDTVIVIGPKHTPYGAAWSIPPQQRWDIPGTSVPIATDLGRQLKNSVASFQCEGDAHRVEHGTEVLLPFLHHLNRNLQVLPLVISGNDAFEDLVPLADALAELVRRSADPPLLVISSDMNHFAPEPENRRFDHIALDAMLTGNPQRLYEEVVPQGISMCGVCPAVAVMLALHRLGGLDDLELVDYRNSAAITADHSSVVGYAGVLLR